VKTITTPEKGILSGLKGDQEGNRAKKKGRGVPGIKTPTKKEGGENGLTM